MEKKGNDCEICRMDGLQIEISREEVFETLNCNQDSESYQIFSEEYEEIKSEVENACHPVILMRQEARSRLYVLYTIGGEPEKLSTKAFSEGDYVRGMLINAMADSALFSLEKELEKILTVLCREQQLGIRDRQEAPADIPMEMQKNVYEVVRASEYGIGISTGYMFDPVKSQAVIFELTEDVNQMRMHHECANCDNFSCPKRRADRLTVRIKDEGTDEVHVLECRAGENLLAVLNRFGIHLAAPCGGKGRCGKCRIQVKKGKVSVSQEDRRKFSEVQLEQGWRLACRAAVQMNLEIVLPKGEDEFWVLGGNRTSNVKNGDTGDVSWGLAVDLGTTTIAMQRISLEDGSVLDTWNGVNHQRSFGADVISRIEASVNGQKELLRKSIRKDLTDGVRSLALRAGGFGGLKKAALAGNTVMMHLLRGYSCEGLMGVPFVPESLKAERISMKELFSEELPDIDVYLFPGAASFVGGDITAGIYDCELERDTGVRMLIDLGTNGEMVLGSSERMLCASTAAGPAFEGGRIGWGMGSLPGAIQGVDIREGRTIVKTIGKKTAEGICGTGVLEAAAALYELGYMDETGRLDDPFFETGYPLAKSASGEMIRITQQDIREIQLAKAAIRAGIDTLLYRYGINADAVEEVYLAGGFGFALDEEKAIAVNMFPGELQGKIRVAGNSSLNGCIRYLMEENDSIPEQICGAMKEVNLSADVMFRQYYIDGMMFGEE